MNVPEEYSMQRLLSQVYAGSEVVAPAEEELPKADYFVMTAAFSDGTDIVVQFRIGNEVEEIRLEPPGIVF